MSPSARGAQVAWDPVVRLTHWGIVLAVLTNGLITEEGSRAHVWVGYTALALLSARLVWGVVGTEAARFSSFPPSLRAALADIGDIVAGRHGPRRSHGPAGALMAYALWGCLLAVTLSGVLMAGSPFAESGVMLDGAGAAGYAESLHHDSEEGLLSEFHEAAATALFWLAALHAAAVAVIGRWIEPGLIRAMTTGSERR
jgi:cytochrome b